MASPHTHFVGIGGAGMSALAAILLDRGGAVSGCDLALNEATAALEARGAVVHAGHDAAHLAGADAVVYTGPAGHTPEVEGARDQGLPVLRRAELLGRLMDERRGVAVAGTHGKTTTTALLASMLVASGTDPSALVGGAPAGWEFGGRGGAGAWLVAEADEYDRSFLTLHPEVAVLTGIDMDHPDIYADLEELTDTFAHFLRGTRPDGRVYVAASSERAVCVARRVGAECGLGVETYGAAPASDWRVRVLAREHGRTTFEIAHGVDFVGPFQTLLPGPHNLDNVCGAVAGALAAGGTEAGIREGLARFGGVARRFEVKGEVRGVTVVDDYAHNPQKVEAVLRAARERYPERRIWILFQPHTYSRTRALMAELASALAGADRAYVLDVYAAREEPDADVSGERLARLVPGAVYAGSLDDAAGRVAREVEPGVVLLTVGAGDVTTLGPKIVQLLERGE